MVGFGLRAKYLLLQLIMALGAFTAPINAVSQPNYEYRLLGDVPQVWYPSAVAACAVTCARITNYYTSIGSPYICVSTTIIYGGGGVASSCDHLINTLVNPTGNPPYVFGGTLIPRLPPATITLSGPSSTKALPAGPALPETATVTENGAPKPGISVSITIAGNGSVSGTTDAAGQFNFTYVPPLYVAATDQLSATCSGCSNTATKTIKVEPCDVCEKVGNPISIATGEKEQTEPDWQDSGTHPLSLTRHYRSYGNTDAGFNAGVNSGSVARWSHNWAATSTTTTLQATVRMGDGSKVIFHRLSLASPWVADNGKDSFADTATSTTYTRASDDSRWSFDASGKLATVTQRNGWVMTLAYNASNWLVSVTNPFGRSLQFGYDGTGKLITVTTPDARQVSYGYDGSARLVSVLYPDTKSRVYAYEDTRWPNALTGITNEAGLRYASFAYDAAGRATSTQHAGSTQTYSVAYPSGAVATTGSLIAGSTVSPSLYQSTSQVTDPLGNLQTYTWQGGDGQVRLLGLNGAFEGSQVASRAFGLGTLTLPSSETDFLGTQTLFTWDLSRQLLLTTTQAANKPEAKATSTQWHPTFRLPVLVTEPGRTTASTYDVRGNKLTEIITDTVRNQTRTQSWAYTAQNLIASSTDPRGQVTQYTYDSAGNLASMRNALNQLTSFTYDGAGRVLSQTEANGLVTSYTYDPRGRMLTTTRGAEVTTMTYTANGQLATLTLPNGYIATHSYDAAQRLIAVADNRGASASYVLDAMGNRVREEIKDASGITASLSTRTITALNRVASVSGAAGQTTTLGYDANGEVVSTTTLSGRTTSQTLDGLRRVRSTTLADNAVASQVWNALDQLTQATDPKLVATSYTYNAFGEVLSETSPDSGTMTYVRDAAGNVTSSTDARGQVTSYTRDALGRPTLISFADGKTQSFSYDNVGNVSQMLDASGSTSYTRDAFSRILQKTQTVADNPANPSSYAVQYVYQSGGAVAQITYPSGLKVFYRRNAAGQIIGVDTQKPGLNQPVTPFVSDITYTALQQPKSWAWKHCSTATCAQANRTFDADGRMTSNEFASYTYDAASRITGITQQLAASRTVFVSGTSGPTTTAYFNTPVSWTVGYDSRDRVISFNRSTSALSSSSAAYSYDANSNRLSALVQQISDTDLNNSFTTADTNASNNQTSNIASNSNRLLGFSQTLSSVRNGTSLSSSTSTTNYSRDAAGNLTSDGLRVFEYDSQNRHSKTIVNDPYQGSKITYLHNALGQRVFKSEPQVDHVSPGASVLGNAFITWLQSNFGWMFAQAQLDATLGQAYVYDDGQLGSTPTLLGEYGNGSTNSLGRYEYLWLPTESGQPIPIGQHRTTILSATHADHLGTPRKITGTDNRTSWQLPYSAFGENAPTGILTVTSNAELALTNDAATATRLATSNPPIVYNLRFPGQYFDSESRLNYNYFRSYQPERGGYTQADPIGLAGGLNRYQYVESNPLSDVDPDGLNPALACYRAGRVGWEIGQRINPYVQPILASAIDSMLLSSSANVSGAAAQRQAEYRRAKDFCDTPPPPGGNDCSTLSRQIDHAEETIRRYEAWDAKWLPGRHAAKLETWKKRLQNLKEEHNQKCTQCR